jgi:2-polyprenyl-3-methyl-5-hydroxy-6-metoxy-1,4-benzoquinol methylase
MTSAREFWFDEETDRQLEPEHRFVWETMLDTVDVDLTGTKVLDIGCNAGGFLRMVADRSGVKAGFGYDPAWRPIEMANADRGDRPLTYAAADHRPTDWTDFDVAFSHEVLFCIQDLGAHARDIFDGLRPGGRYYAVMGTHSRNPQMAEFHAEVRERLGLPDRVYAIEDVIGAFAGAGFEPHVGRMPFRFLPQLVLGDDAGAALDYYARHKLMFKFVRPD